jgi:hypothetical protein
VLPNYEKASKQSAFFFDNYCQYLMSISSIANVFVLAYIILLGIQELNNVNQNVLAKTKMIEYGCEKYY